MKGNSKCTSGTLFSPFEAQNKDLGAVSQTLLNEVKLRLPRRQLDRRLTYIDREES